MTMRHTFDAMTRSCDLDFDFLRLLVLRRLVLGLRGLGLRLGFWDLDLGLRLGTTDSYDNTIGTCYGQPVHI